jgi:hypothetical protein
MGKNLKRMGHNLAQEFRLELSSNINQDSRRVNDLCIIVVVVTS